MKQTKAYRSFEGAADLAQHATTASNYLKEVCAACAAGDRTAAQRALRQAISELETARAGLRQGGARAVSAVLSSNLQLNGAPCPCRIFQTRMYFVM